MASKTTHYRKLRRAKELGCSVEELPDGRGKHGHQARGTNCARWNDAKIISDDGYVKVRVGGGHPLADPNGYTYEHVIVWVSAGNSLPGFDELLHHKDENKQNNRYDNLELKKRGRHNAEHNAKRFARGVLSENDIRNIIGRRNCGEPLFTIACDYGIAFQTVSKICRGKLYAEIFNKAAGRTLDGREWNEIPEAR